MIKTQSITQFQFTFITNEKSYTDTPVCLSAFRLVRELPHDILQLERWTNEMDSSLEQCNNEKYRELLDELRTVL